MAVWLSDSMLVSISVSVSGLVSTWMDRWLTFSGQTVSICNHPPKINLASASTSESMLCTSSINMALQYKLLYSLSISSVSLPLPPSQYNLWSNQYHLCVQLVECVQPSSSSPNSLTRWFQSFSALSCGSSEMQGVRESRRWHQLFTTLFA